MSMKQKLDQLIDQSDDGVISAQIMLVSGYQFNGAVERSDVDDVYESLSAVPQKDERTGATTVKMHRLFFRGEDLRVIAMESKEDAPQIVTPGNGIRIPGVR